MSSYVDPTVQDFKDYFVRDFPYGTTLSDVMNADITRAMNDTSMFINPNLFDSQGSYTVNFLLLSAHNLVMNLRASSQGVSGSYSWLTSSKGVGSVNESYSIPDRILENPELSMLSKTNYGSKFLFNILPQLTGQTFTSCGTTQP